MAQEIVWHATDLTLARDTDTGDVTVVGPPETLARMAREATDRAILDATAALMADAHTDGEPSVPNSVFFARLGARIVHFLTTRTSAGVLSEVDTLLRSAIERNPAARKQLEQENGEVGLAAAKPLPEIIKAQQASVR